jgi:hypothetical protein
MRLESLSTRGRTFAPHSAASKAYGIWISVPRSIAYAKLPTKLLRKMLGIRTLIAVRTDNHAVGVVGGFEALILLAHLDARRARPSVVTVAWINDESEISLTINAEIALALGCVATARSAAGMMALTRELDPDVAHAVWGQRRPSASTIARATGIRRGQFIMDAAHSNGPSSSLLRRIVARGNRACGRSDLTEDMSTLALGDRSAEIADEDI